MRLFNPHETARADELAGAQLASFRRRLAAYLIDMLLVGSTYLLAMTLVQAAGPEGMFEDKVIVFSAHVKATILFSEIPKFGWMLWLILYYGLIVWKTNGLTPGKRLLRIRVASLQHTRITLWQSIERALGYGASMLEGGFGFIQYFIEPNHRCVHDRIAETIVIRDRKPATLVADGSIR